MTTTENYNTREHIAMLLKYMSVGIFGKENILAMSLLCAVAGESLFLLGPPGTAKSLVARRLKLVFKDAQAFEYLMSRFSTPEEIFGPVSISKLKNEDRYERITNGYLPDCTIAFLDEIWKAGPAIQNALLTVINERIYKNGTQTYSVPMKVLIAASNELPAEDEGLEALWDRFLVRMVSNCISDEQTFFKMIRQDRQPQIIIPEELLITDELFASWQSAIINITIPDEVCTIVSNIRKLLKEEEKKQKSTSLDLYVSDRRWKKLFHLMKTSAWLNGRSAINETDCILLIHCLWNKAELITKTMDCVIKAFTLHIGQQIASLYDRIDKAVKEKSSEVQTERNTDAESSNDYVLENNWYYILKKFRRGKCLFLMTELKYLSTARDIDGFVYWDSRNWMIRALYRGIPSYGFRSVENIKLCKCKGGIMIDGIPYEFQRKSDGSDSTLLNRPLEQGPEENTVFRKFQMEFSEISDSFYSLSARLKEGNNLFVADNDSKLLLKQIKTTEASLNELCIKLTNSKMLL